MIRITVPMVGPLRLGGYGVTKIMRLVPSRGDATFGWRVQMTPSRLLKKSASAGLEGGIVAIVER